MRSPVSYTHLDNNGDLAGSISQRPDLMPLQMCIRDRMGVPILGTAAEDVDAAEDRELFDKILEKCQIPRPAGHTVFTAEEAKQAAAELGYPVLVLSLIHI